MIPILFGPNEKNFITNGIGRLSDSIDCEVVEERNGIYTLTLTYPINGIHYSDIAEDYLIYAKPFDGGQNQVFRIYSIERPINGIVTVYAEHISYDQNKITVMPCSAGSCAAALAAIKANSYPENDFIFWTDKAVNASFSITKPAPLRSVLGGTSGSILDVYGAADYEFDNWYVKLHQNRGQDNGVTLRYGKNITDLESVIDLSGVYTGIIPYWASEESGTVMLSDKVVWSSYRTAYSRDLVCPVDFSSNWQSAPTEEQLTAAAQQYLETNKPWEPQNNIKVSFVALWQTEEYKNIAALQRVKMCDTVTVIYDALGVNVAMKVIKTSYDVLSERYKSIELGSSRNSLAKEINKTQGEIERVTSEQISTMQKALDHATQLMKGGLGGHVVIGTDSDGRPNEILIMDTDNINTAVNVIRMNMNGIAFSNNGYDPASFRTAWTIDGSFVADFITAGTLDAGLITAGVITDRAGNNRWDLDNSEFHMSSLSQYQTIAQRDADMQTISGQIQDAMDYTDGEIASVNQNITALSVQTSNRFDVMNDEFSSQIKAVRKAQTLHHFIPENLISEGLDWNNWWRPAAAANHFWYDSEKKCIVLDGTSMTSADLWYIYRRDLTVDDAMTLTVEIEFEIDGIDSSTNINKTNLSFFSYMPESGSGFIGNGAYVTVADGNISVTNYGNLPFTQDEDNPNRWIGNVVKGKSRPDNEERAYLYFLPGYKVYVYDFEIYITNNVYTDITISNISQKTDIIQAEVESFQSMQHNFVSEDYTSGDGWTGLGDGSYTTFDDTFDGNPCVTLNGGSVAPGSGAWSDMVGYVAVIYRLNITEVGEYSYSFKFATDANFNEEGKILAYFYYCFENPDADEKETIPIITTVGVSTIRIQAHTANESVEYSGVFRIPKTTSYTTRGGTRYENIEVKLVYRDTYQDAELGYSGFWLFIPHGVESHIYDFGMYGSGDAYAKSVLSIARAEIATEVSRATNAETSLDSKITQTENSITSEVAARQADTQALSSRITQNASAIQSEVVARQADTTSLSSRITQNANSITTKVNKGDIASTINQTAQSVKIQASKIDLSGYVTVSSLGSGGSTTIDGSRITTGMISASRVAISDTTNFAQLNEKTYSSYGFTQYTSGTDIWYQLTNSRRDYALSEKYTVNGAEKYRVKCTIFTNAKAITENGGSTVEYIGVGIGLFCGRGNGTWFSYPKTTMAKATSSSGTTLTIDEIVTLPADARKMSVYLHTEGWGNYSGTIRVKDLTVTRATTAELIVDGSVTADKIAANAITAAKISTAAVESGKIKDGAISAAKIANDAVTTDKIPASAITTVKIADNAITAGKITANAVTAAKIKAGAVETDKIAAEAITAAKIAADAVTADKIKAGAVTADKIKAGAIEVGKIKDGAVTTAKLADSAVTSDKIPSAAITTVKIADGAISAGKIAANAVTAGKIKAGAVETDKIAAGAITAGKIATDAVTADKIKAGAITADKIAANAINGKTITGATIQTASSGARILMDTSSSVKGYNGSTLVNILNMSQSISSKIQMTIDAVNQLNIRTPKVAVVDRSYGTGSGTATVTRTGDTNYVSDVEKSWDGAFEVYINVRDGDWNTWDMYCTLPVYLNVKYSKFHTIHGMQTTNETVRTNKI